MRRLSTRARWAVPAGIVAAAGLVAAASAVASADLAPALPARSVAQLLAKVALAAAKPIGPVTATVQESSSLGLPALPSANPSQGTGPLGLAQNNETVNVWYLGQTHIRIAEQTQMGESDLRLDGRALWLWNSKTQTATRVILPSHFDRNGLGPDYLSPGHSVSSGAAAIDPLALAAQLLAALGPSTRVSLERNVTVAGRPAYQLSLVPKTSRSLIGQVLIAIDARRFIPLRVEIFARGSSSPAYEAGFTALTFGRPSASNFSFTPPPGARVKTVTVPTKPPSGLGLGSLGLGSLGVGGNGLGGLVPGGFLNSGGFGSPNPDSAAPGLRAPSISTNKPRASASTPGNGGQTVVVVATTGQVVAIGKDQPTVIGKSWLSVIATPPNPSVAAAVQQLLTRTTGSVTPGSAGSAAPGTSNPVGPDLAVLRELLKATTSVHGAWGSGRLLRTTLVSVLITSNGAILAGAVTPAVLYADAVGPAK